MADYRMTEAQWSQINSALLTAAGVCVMHFPEGQPKMLEAAIVMDDIVDAAELAEIKPLSTYPEDRAKMVDLCARIEKSCDDSAAIDLADLVKAILDDEATV